MSTNSQSDNVWYNGDMQHVTFQVGEHNLDGNLYFPEIKKEKSPGIIFIHGWRSSQQNSADRAVTLTDHGYVCLTFDLRGGGKSEGDITTLTREDFLQDCIAAYDLLAKTPGVDPTNISVIGSSFGSYLGILLTQKRSVKNLVLRVPANYPDTGFDKPQILFSGENDPTDLQGRFTRLGNTKTYASVLLEKFTGPVLIIASEFDEIIPRQTVEHYVHNVLDPSKVTYIIMPGAKHSLLDEKSKQAFSEIVSDWFQSLC